jgi:hypothetical protein
VIDEEGLHKCRKRVPLGRNFEALEFARSLGTHLAIDLIVDPDWDRERFRVLFGAAGDHQPQRQHALYRNGELVDRGAPPGDPWLPTVRYPARRTANQAAFGRVHDELLSAQRAIYRKHIDWRGIGDVIGLSARLLLRGQTNFVRSLFKLNSAYRPELLLADHARRIDYEMPLRTAKQEKPGRTLYVHTPRGRTGRAIDAATERFVDETRAGAGS